MRPSFFHHLHPPTIPQPQARWRYTLGAGGLSVFLVVVLILTGTLEMFYYVASPENAATSVQLLTFLVPFGGVVRGLHFWAAQALVVVALLHLLRVVFTGAYAPPRRFNYLLGLCLLVLVLFLDFTGYVLRWDEGIRWALVAGTNLVKSIPALGDGLYAVAVGGGQPSAATLTRFYAWHIFGLTLVLVAVGAWHVFRVRRDGGIAAPPPAARGEAGRITRFDLVRREALAMLLATAALLLAAAFLPTPIGPAIDPSSSLGPAGAEARAPWFFLWVQQLLRLGNPFWMGVAVPAGVLLFLGLLPWALPGAPPGQLGRWFPPAGRSVQVITGALAVVILALTILGAIST